MAAAVNWPIGGSRGCIDMVTGDPLILAAQGTITTATSGPWIRNPGFNQGIQIQIGGGGTETATVLLEGSNDGLVAVEPIFESFAMTHGHSLGNMYQVTWPWIRLRVSAVANSPSVQASMSW